MCVTEIWEVSYCLLSLSRPFPIVFCNPYQRDQFLRRAAGPALSSAPVCCTTSRLWSAHRLCSSPLQHFIPQVSFQTCYDSMAKLDFRVCLRAYCRQILFANITSCITVKKFAGSAALLVNRSVISKLSKKGVTLNPYTNRFLTCHCKILGFIIAYN